MKSTVKFVEPQTDRARFFFVLRKRVDAYFKEKNISKYGDYRMVIKTIVMLLMYFVPYFMIISNAFTPWQMFGLVLIMGVGVAGIGLSIMHDGNHGSYSPDGRINKLMGYSLNLVGGCDFTWKLQHNVLHHTYTNIAGMDDDIRERYIIRLSPHARLHWIHKFQHIYAIFLYGFQTFVWILFKDFKQFKEYNERGLIKPSIRNRELAKLLVTKVFYVFYFMVIPMMLVDITWWQYVIGFVSMHYVAGMILSIIFQMAHVIEETAMPAPNAEGEIENAWAIHQMETTANFSQDNPILNWYAGGLNFQVEHHLFPRISHVHYKAISEIVRETAKEYGVPYNEKRTLLDAVKSHLRLLKRLGHGEKLEMAHHH